MDYHSLPRKDLQVLCKKHGIPANKTNVFMADALAKRRVPLSDVSVNKEVENDLFAVTPSKISTAKSTGENAEAALFSNTPFLRRGSKKRESAPVRSSVRSDKHEDNMLAARAVGLFQLGETESENPKISTKSAPVARSLSIKDGLEAFQREEIRSRESAQVSAAAAVEPNPVEKSSIHARAVTGPPHQPDVKREKLDISANGTEPIRRKSEVKHSSELGSVGAELRLNGSRSGSGGPSAKADRVAKVKSDSRTSSLQHSVSGAVHSQGSELSSSDTSTQVEIASNVIPESKASPSGDSLALVDEQDEVKSGIEDLSLEGFTNSPRGAVQTQTHVGQDPIVEAEHNEGSELVRPDTPTRQKYVVKVTFADKDALDQDLVDEESKDEETEVRRTDNSNQSIEAGDKEGSQHGKPKERFTVKVTFAEKDSLGRDLASEKPQEETKVRKTDTSAATGQCPIKLRWGSKPSTSQSFVFGATRQEGGRPKRTRSSPKENLDVQVHADPKSTTIVALKQEGRITRRAAVELRETTVAKAKPEVKACSLTASGSYLKPQKKPRLAGTKVATELKPTVEKGQPTTEPKGSLDIPECHATPPEEFKPLDLPMWAKEYKRKREEDTLSSTCPDPVSPGKSVDEETVALPAPILSPLKNIEDRVVRLLDRLKGFCWKTEIPAIVPGIQTLDEDVPEVAGQIEIEVTPLQ